MSTYCDYAIKDRDALKNYIMVSLGYPLVQVELTEEMLDIICIDPAVEEYTKFAQMEKQNIWIDLTGYVANSGFLMPSNVASIYVLNDDGASNINDVNRLFSFSNMMANYGTLAIPYPGESWGWINYELSLQYLELTKRMLGGGFQFEFNPRTHMLTLYPDPVLEKMKGFIVFGCNIIRPEEQIFGEEWCRKYALALAKITLGRVRGKYNNTQLLGGGQIDKEILVEGIRERDELYEKIRMRESGVFAFHMG
jgi:hypothetical protein